jgi:hypothetical protein
MIESGARIETSEGRTDRPADEFEDLLRKVHRQGEQLRSLEQQVYRVLPFIRRRLTRGYTCTCLAILRAPLIRLML